MEKPTFIEIDPESPAYKDGVQEGIKLRVLSEQEEQSEESTDGK